MKRIGDTFHLSTGRELNANCGILGLYLDTQANPPRDRLTSGYDNMEPCDEPACLEADQLRPQLTQDERREIAIFQAARWLAWGEQ